MNRLAWLVGSGALVAWGFAGALGGCGSSDATIDGSDVDGGEAGSGTSGGTSGNPGAEGGGGTDGSSGGADGSSGGADAGNPEGGGGEAGLKTTPDKVACGGGMSCTTPTDVCCVNGTGDAGCIPSGDTCSGAKLRCDEKADCTGADICCGGFGGGAGGTECKTACGGNQVQLCKTSAECTGGTCYVNTCPTLMGGTIKIESCTKLSAPCTQ